MLQRTEADVLPKKTWSRSMSFFYEKKSINGSWPELEVLSIKAVICFK